MMVTIESKARAGRGGRATSLIIPGMPSPRSGEMSTSMPLLTEWKRLWQFGNATPKPLPDALVDHTKNKHTRRRGCPLHG